MSTTTIETLRLAVNLFSNCSEGFNQQFTAAELIRIYCAYKASGWDITPDRWEARQVADALVGIAPQWTADETPIYGN